MSPGDASVQRVRVKFFGCLRFRPETLRRRKGQKSGAQASTHDGVSTWQGQGAQRSVVVRSVHRWLNMSARQERVKENLGLFLGRGWYDECGMKAVIDIGTNSVLLLLGRRGADGRVEIERDEARVARLGEGVAKRGSLLPEAIDRTIAILEDYRQLADAAGAPIEAVATEGLRLASDREVFLGRAHQALGVPVRMISGEDEARLSYLSVAREHPDVAVMRVIDIGGASTELVSGRGEQIESVVSHKVGSVRLTEAHVRHDPISGDEIEAIEAEARAALHRQPLPPVETLYGLAGTVTTTAALLLGLREYDRERVDGTRWGRAEIAALRDRLAAETIETRMQRTGLAPGRADVVVAGISVLLVALDHCGATTLAVRDRGLRYALL